MNRVSIRTLVLMIGLFGFFVAYQCLAFIPAKPAGTTHAAKLQDTPQAPTSTDASEGPATTPGDQAANAAHEMPAAECAIEVRETPRTWRVEKPVDPNDRVPPDGSEPASDDVE
jgi:hypothetical protein